MDYWSNSYADKIINLDYDYLTEDPARLTKVLISSLGLTWDSRCLTPHENRRSIRTASQQQVRRKIYKGSSKEWKHYEPFLKGFLNKLNRKKLKDQ